MLNTKLGILLDILLCIYYLFIKKLGILFHSIFLHVFYMTFPFKLCFWAFK